MPKRTKTKVKKYKKKKQVIPSDDEASDINFSDNENMNEGNDSEIPMDNMDDDMEDEDKLDNDMGVDDGDGEDNEADDNDDCIYKKTKTDRDRAFYVNDDDDDDDTDVEEVNDDNRYVPKEDRKSKPYLFKFERVRLLQDRAGQIIRGSDPMIKNVNHLSAKTIAKLELESTNIPLYIERDMPGGKIEVWRVDELKNRDKELIVDVVNKKYKTKLQIVN